MQYWFHKRPSGIIGILILVLSISNLYGQYRDRMRVIFENEGRDTDVSIVRKDDVVYASLEAFADLLGVRHVTNPRNKKTVLRVGSQLIKVTARNPFVMVDNDVYQLALETFDVEGSIYVPLALFLEAIGECFPAEFDLDQGSRILRIDRSRINITGVEIEEKDNGSLIRLVTTHDFKSSDIAASVNRGWLYVTVHGGLIDSVQIASEKQMGIVKKIEPYQFEESAYISFLLDGEIVDHQVYVEEGEIVVSLRSPKGSSTKPVQPSNDGRERWLIDKIVIDPGHGGKDPGGVGPSGLKEKDVNLDIAKRVRDLLKKKLDVDVLLTRQDDRFLELNERTQFANSHGAKLFISIHANINKVRTVRGFSTYVMGAGKNKQAIEVAEKENSVIELEDSDEVYKQYTDVRYIMNAIAQSSYLKESQEFASMINENMRRKTKLSKFGKGIYQAPFYVLIGAAMPRVLVETAFLSNRHEERLLRTRSFKQKVAEAIYESIQEFKEKCEKGIGHE